MQRASRPREYQSRILRIVFNTIKNYKVFIKSIAIWYFESLLIDSMSVGKPSWSEQARLCFLERLLFWRGYINRKDLVEQFGISGPQATNDLVGYCTLAPGNCAYNIRTKRYEAADEMVPALIVPDFDNDMMDLKSAVWPDRQIDFVVQAEQPLRTASIPILQFLLRSAHAGKSVEIRYFSLSSGTAIWRRISPRAFGSDGLRWHIRAYCHEHEEFRDFVISRMKGVRNPVDCKYAKVSDEDWITKVQMVIKPNPDIDTTKRKALEMDYGMKRGALKLIVRKAMIPYTARRLGFIGDWQKPQCFPMLNELKELCWEDVLS